MEEMKIIVQKEGDPQVPFVLQSELAATAAAGTTIVVATAEEEKN